MTKSRSRRPANDEQAFLAAYDAAQYAHPSVTVDVALVTVADGRLRAILAPRDEHPHLGRWALPGGFVRMDESLDAAAARVLADQGRPARHLSRTALYIRPPGPRPPHARYHRRLLRPGRCPQARSSVARR